MIIHVSFLLSLFIYAAGAGKAGKARPEKYGHRTAAMNAKDISIFFVHLHSDYFLFTLVQAVHVFCQKGGRVLASFFKINALFRSV